MAEATKNFRVEEFACKCGCGANNISQTVINMCQKIRENLGLPVRINSGYRCKQHNAKVGGVKNSYHTQGLAADLSCAKGALALWTVIQNMWNNGELPELSYAIKYANFVHIDCGKKRKHVFEVKG